MASQKVAVSAHKFAPREPRGCNQGAPTPPRCQRTGTATRGPSKALWNPLPFPPSLHPSSPPALCSPAKAICSPVGVMSVSVLSPPGAVQGVEAPRGGGGTACSHPCHHGSGAVGAFWCGKARAGALAQLQACTNVCMYAHTQMQACKQRTPALSHARLCTLLHNCTRARRTSAPRAVGGTVRSHTRVVLTVTRVCLHGRTLGAPCPPPCSPRCFRASTGARRRDRALHARPGTSHPPRLGSQGFLGGLLPAVPGHVGPPKRGLAPPERVKGGVREARPSAAPLVSHPRYILCSSPSPPSLGRGGVTSGAGAQRVLAPSGPGPAGVG